MHQKPVNSEADKVACEVCLMEIPRDLARSDEATGYVHYFCGESCYAKWKEPGPQTGGIKPAGS